MKVYYGAHDCCPRCERPDTIGRIPRRGWMRLVPGSKHISCRACNMDFVIVGRVDIREDFSVEELFETEDRRFYVQNEREDVYGPFDLEELAAQAADTRLGPDHMISPDRDAWFHASEIEELEMNWLVRFPDGTEYGPIHIRAVKELFRSDQIGHDAAALHKNTHETRWVADL